MTLRRYIQIKEKLQHHGSPCCSGSLGPDLNFDVSAVNGSYCCCPAFYPIIRASSPGKISSQTRTAPRLYEWPRSWPTGSADIYGPRCYHTRSAPSRAAQGCGRAGAPRPAAPAAGAAGGLAVTTPTMTAVGLRCCCSPLAVIDW